MLRHLNKCLTNQIKTTMKKLLVLYFFLAIPLFCVCQTETIKGIGKLKLDMPLKEVQSIFPKSLQMQKTNSKVKKIYKANSYTPIEGTTLKGLHLYFYKDTLYSIYIDEVPMSLKRDLMLKYGKPDEIFPDPYFNLRTFRSHVEYQTFLYKSDAVDFYDEKNVDNYGYEGTIYEWNRKNPFIETRLAEISYYCKDELCLDMLFIIKNLAYSKCVELEEEKLKKEDNDNRLKELDGL